MQYLLDTHIVLWMLNDDTKLTKPVRDIIIDTSVSCSFSIVSIWEIAIKKNIGKLTLDVDIITLEKELQKLAIEIVPINTTALHYYENLPIIETHKDPFDRLIIATAITNNFTVISTDFSFKLYEPKLKLF